MISIEPCGLFGAFLKISLHLFKVPVYGIIVNFLEVLIFRERHCFLTLPEQVVLECGSYLRNNSRILSALFATPLLTGLVLPSLVLTQTLTHDSTRFSLLVPKLDQAV